MIDEIAELNAKLGKTNAVCALAIAGACLLFLAWWAGGRREVLLDGTYESGFEASAFFPDGNCSKKPFWFHWPDERDYDMDARIKALEFPAALRVKLVANVSRLGQYGHLGGYPREVWPIKIISVDPAPPCGPGSPKPDFYDAVWQNLVGQRITIRGKFSLLGKIGPYIALDEGQEVYLVHGGSFTWGRHYSEMEGKRVAARGILRFYHAPPTERTDRAVAHAPDYFYLEVETAHLRLYPE
ncbi:MAG TPA: hypothetical protein VGK21_09900 [Candidatus Angelobacter sp.]|jgi:hypothetical protein